MLRIRGETDSAFACWLQAGNVGVAVREFEIGQMESLHNLCHLVVTWYDLLKLQCKSEIRRMGSKLEQFVRIMVGTDESVRGQNWSREALKQGIEGMQQSTNTFTSAVAPCPSNPVFVQL